MTEDDIRFVRKVAHRVKLGEGLLPSEVCLFLILLVEAEAMREKAEFLGKRFTYREGDAKRRLEWSDSDWIRRVRERWGLE